MRVCLAFVCICLVFPGSTLGSDYVHTIYVDPSTGEDNSGCLKLNSDSSPCQNLTWVFQQIKYSSTNYVLSQGTHFLMDTGASHFENLQHVAFTGNGSIVQCIETGLAFIGIKDITLHSISFTGCSAIQNSTNTNYTDGSSTSIIMVAIYFYLCESINMSEVSVRYSPSGTGVVIYDTNGTNTFSNSNFSDNRVTRTPEQPVGGGAFYVEFTYCPPGILHCDTGNNKRNYGAIYNFTNCDFSNNHVNYRNSKIITSYLVPYHSDHLAFRNGGGLSIYIKGGASKNQITFTKCRFHNNTALLGSGLFVDFMDSSHSNVVNVSQCSFDRNYCPYTILEGMQGGGMRIGHYVYGLAPLPNGSIGNSVKVENCNFTNNSALHGGGISLSLSLQQALPSQLASIHLLGNRFERNTAKLGAAIKIGSFGSIVKGLMGNIQVENCWFTSNSVDYAKAISKAMHPHQTGIGTLYIDDVPVKLKGNITFHANNGSAIAVMGAMINFTSGHALFSKNWGRIGAAISLLGHAFIQVSNGTSLTFIQNTANSRGGAIYNNYITRENQKSDRTCFIRHANPFLHPDEWNATFTFKGNTDMGGHRRNSIHSTSTLPCQVPGGSGYINETVRGFCWKNWFYTPKKNSSNCDAEVTSDIGNITLFSNFHLSTFPGWSFKLPVKLEDDLNHGIDDALFEITYNDTNSVYTYGKNNVVIMGEPNENVELAIDTVEYRMWHFHLIANLKPCPAGFELKNFTTHDDDIVQQCACSGSYRGAVFCDDISKTVKLLSRRWIGKINNSDDFYVAMNCPPQFCKQSGGYTNIAYKPQDDIDWDTLICGPEYRTGISCGECIEGYGPAVNSPTFQCVNCSHINFAVNMATYIATVYLPLAIFFSILILFDIRLTTGPANAFILYCQMVTGTFDLSEFGEVLTENKGVYAYKFLYGIFNLNLFENFIPPICLSTNFNALTVLALDYVIASFPLLTIVVAIVCLKISENCCMYISTKHKRHLLCLRSALSGSRKKTIRDALLPSFASFLLLSYTKFSATSFYILMKQYPVNSSGNQIGPPRVYFASQLSTTQSSYLYYYCVPAIIVFLTIVMLTPFLLLDYPLRALEWFIERVKCFKQIYPNDKIHLFLNLFYGCYRSKMRFFVGLYFLFRLIVNLSCILSNTWLEQLLVQQLATIVMIALLVLCQPYEWKLLNFVDTLIFVNLALLNSIALYLYSFVNIHPEHNPPIAAIIIQNILVFLPLIYMLAFIIWKVTSSCRPQVILMFKKWLFKSSTLDHSYESMFDRAGEHNTYTHNQVATSENEGENTRLLNVQSY